MWKQQAGQNQVEGAQSEERRRREEEEVEASRRQEEQFRRQEKGKEEEEGRQRQAELAKQREIEEAQRRQEESAEKQEARRRQVEGEEAQRRQEEVEREQAREAKLRLDEEARQRQEEEARREKNREAKRLQDEEDAQRRHEMVAQQRQESDARERQEFERKLRQEEEARQRQQEKSQAAARKEAEEARRKYEMEQAAQIRRKQEEEQAAERQRILAEAELRRQQEEEEERQRRLEEAQRQKAEWAERRRLEQQREEREQYLKELEEERRRQEEEEEAQHRILEHAEQQRLAEEELQRAKRRTAAQHELQRLVEVSSQGVESATLKEALAAARTFGVEGVAPSLVRDGDRILKRIQVKEQQQKAMQGVEAAIHHQPRESSTLRDAIASAREAGVPEVELKAAEKALAEAYVVEMAQQRAEEAKESARQELHGALVAGEPDRLSRAIDSARKTGVEESACSNADKHLMALRFVVNLRAVDKGPVLHAWRAATSDVRAATAAIKLALDNGADASSIQEAARVGAEVGADEDLCARAEAVAVQRRDAHDQIACALVTRDLEDLRSAQTLHEAAGGPASDAPYLAQALKEAQATDHMLKTLDERLPSVVDVFLSQMESERRKQQQIQAKAANTNVKTPARKSMDDEEPKGTSELLPKPRKQGEILAGGQVPPPPPPIATNEVVTRDDTEDDRWHDMYAAMKARVDRARMWLTSQKRPTEIPVQQHFPRHAPEPAVYSWHACGSQAPYSAPMLLGQSPPRVEPVAGPTSPHCYPPVLVPMETRSIASGNAAAPPWALPQSQAAASSVVKHQLEPMAGPTHYRDMMESAARLADTMPRRHYEDPSYWR